MNILFLEDRGASTYNVKRWMLANGHNVLDAFNPNDAKSHWDFRKNINIHCIILDLQVPMDGLSSEQKEDAEGGTLAGWVWLRDSVLKEEPTMRQRIIIYSNYIGVLKEKILPKELYEGIKLIPKQQRVSAANMLIAYIKEISQLI